MRRVLAASVIAVLASGCGAPAPPSGSWNLGGGIAIAPDGQVLVSGRVRSGPTWMTTTPGEDTQVRRAMALDRSPKRQ